MANEYQQILSGSAAKLIASGQMLGGVAFNKDTGAYLGLPATNNTVALTTAQQVGILGNSMSGSQSVIHALNKLSASVDSSNDLTFGDGSSTGEVSLGSQTFVLAGTSNEVETSAADQTLTIGLPNDVTIGGTLTATTAVVPAVAGVATLGSATAEFGDVFVADDKNVQLGSDQDYKIGYDESTRDALVLEAKEGAGFSMFMMADNGDDAGDEYSMNVADGGVFTLKHDRAVEGTQAATLTITPSAAAASADVAEFSGIVKLGGNTIQASDGGTAITLDTSDNVTIGNDLTTTGGLTVDGSAGITMDNGATIVNGDTNTLTITEAGVVLSGDLTVQGNDINFAAGAANLGASIGANIFTVGGASTQTKFSAGGLRVGAAAAVEDTVINKRPSGDACMVGTLTGSA